MIGQRFCKSTHEINIVLYIYIYIYSLNKHLDLD